VAVLVGVGDWLFRRRKPGVVVVAGGVHLSTTGSPLGVKEKACGSSRCSGEVRQQ
jgi:hypothetical protein